LVNDPAGTQVAAQVYDRLLGFRPGTVELAPGIATNWVSDPEGRTFTFTLRDELRFHDGTPLDATSVVWNFERWMNPDHPEHVDGFISWRDYFGGCVGQRDDQDRAINLVAEVTALDPRTVRLTLNAPFAPLLHHLAMVPFGFASPAAVRSQGEDYGSDGDHLPVGSGPFRAVGWYEDGTVVLVPNADHWAGQPASPGIRFTPIPRSQDRARAAVSGEVHGADLPATTDITGTITSPDVLVGTRPSRSTAWLMLNHSRDPLGELPVRRAISLAIDRERLAREQFGTRALVANQLLPPGFLGYEDTLEPLRYDPNEARAILSEAGYGDGFRLNIWVANTPRGYLPDPTGAAASIAEMLQAVGIDARVRSESLRQFLMDRDRGRFTAWLIGWEAQSGDPDNTWFWHFGAGRIASEGQYERSDLAAALLAAQRTINSAERESIYRAAARTVHADLARVFLAHVQPLVVTSRRVEGFEPSPMGFDAFRDVTLAPGPSPDSTPTRGSDSATSSPAVSPESADGTPSPEEGNGTAGAAAADTEEGGEPTSAPPDSEAAETSEPTLPAGATVEPLEEG
jgi:peptide/nickel transport system substrate-binding protein